MAITQTLSNNAPFLYNAGMATKQDSPLLANVPVLETNDICVCAIGCEYTENVFAKVGGFWWKNDKNDFLFQKLISADTIVFKIYKADVLQATITNNTYGDFYAFGSLGNALYTGFVVHWEKVFNAWGSGYYQIKAEKTLLGVSSTFESQQFFLQEYTDTLADSTVRIESYQTGNILSSEFDYTGLLSGGWYSSFRIGGRLNSPDIKIEVDNIFDENYKQIQVQVKTDKEWSLETKLLPAIISNRINFDNANANQFLVTDYNIYNHEIYRRRDLYITNIEKKKEHGRNRNRGWVLTLSDTLQNNVKRNY